MKTKFTHSLQRVFLLISIAFSVHLLNAEKCAEWPFMLNCPPNVTVSCTDNISNLSQFGNATYTTNSGTFSAGHPTVQYQLNNCNTGSITRTWMVQWNWIWYSCTQTITVGNGGYYGANPIIYWPEDYEIGGCNPNIQPNALPLPNRFPTWTSGPCNILGRSYSDMVFYVNNSCKKVKRMWKVIDWCTYNSNNPSGGGIWTHTQEIKIIDTQEPEVICVPEIVSNSFNCKDAFVNAASLVVDTSRCGGEFEISNNSPFSTSKGDNISGVYPIGTTKVTYTIKYACGYRKTCHTNVVVKNAAKPTPYCLGHIITTLMPLDTDNDGKSDAGMVELWAKDLDRGSKAMCGFNPLRFSFSPDSIVMNRTFTCNDLGKNQIYLYVSDSKGNQSSCLVTVEIQNNSNIPDCFPPPPPPAPDPDDEEDDTNNNIVNVSGNVFNQWGESMEGLEISLESLDAKMTITTWADTINTMKIDSFRNASGYWVYRYIMEKKIVEKSDTTYIGLNKQVRSIESGSYTFDISDEGIISAVISSSIPDTAHRNSINSKDVETLTRYLLGQYNFTSSYQFLAADVNEDGKINTDDLSALIQYVTNNAKQLPGEKEWFVIAGSPQFENIADILSSVYANNFKLDSISESVNGLDFTVVRKGDIVKENPDTPGLQSEVLAFRNSGSFTSSEIDFIPNPFQDELLIRFTAEYAQVVEIRFSDATGKILANHRFNANSGMNQFSITGSDFHSGLIIYNVHINGITSGGKLIKI